MVSQKVNDATLRHYAVWKAYEDPAQRLAGYDAMLPPLLDGYTTTRETIGGVPGLWVDKVGRTTDRVILYFHGGGHHLGSAQGYSGLVSRMTEAGDSRAFVVDTSVIPDGLFPKPFDESLAVYSAFIDDRRVDPSKLVVGGDSAGAGLALAVLVAVRDAGGQLPAGLFLLSPWSDLTHSGDTFLTHEGYDPMVTKKGMDIRAAAYLGDADPSDLRASPGLADMHDLPPTLIQVGSTEALFADALIVADKMRRADVLVDLEVAYEMTHVYQMFIDDFPQATESLTRIGRFVAKLTGA